MNDLIPVVLTALVCLLFFLSLGFLYRSRMAARRQEEAERKRQKKQPGKGEKHSNCPLCNSDLFAGENIVSRVYKGSDPKDQACTIHGCPYCYPVPKPGVIRTCPVCHKNVPLQGHLDAHLFLRENGKRHVHITGCTECHKKR